MSKTKPKAKAPTKTPKTPKPEEESGEGYWHIAYGVIVAAIIGAGSIFMLSRPEMRGHDIIVEPGAPTEPTEAVQLSHSDKFSADIRLFEQNFGHMLQYNYGERAQHLVSKVLQNV